MIQNHVLVVDLGADYQEKVTGLVNLLSEMGVERVLRPRHMVEFVKLAGLSSIQPKEVLPALIVNLHFQQQNQVKEVMRAAETAGISMINKYSAAAKTSHRLSIAQLLRRNEIPAPDFYFGHPRAIPEEFGEIVIYKQLEGHLVLQMVRGMFHSLEELVYVEKMIPNPAKALRSVYCVAGLVFTVEKPDDFHQTGIGEKKLTETTDRDREIAVKIGQITGLEIFNVDIIVNGDGKYVVIDVNAWPNFFFYEPAVVQLAEEIKRRVMAD